VRYVTTVIIGAGQSGLAMSKHLTDRSIDHVLIERGEVANSWQTERWDSLRLLTPNWQSRLPGYAYDGADPDGYMSVTEVVGYLKKYAGASGAPIHARTKVMRVRQVDGGYEVSYLDWWQADGNLRTVSAPMLIIGLVVGILVSLLQAVTQIQEQTLSFIPKIVAMVAAAILLMPWTAQRLMEYSREMFTNGLMN